MKIAALAFVPFLLASQALASPATQDGADHLTAVFQSYLGATENVISVAPVGEVYDITLDFTPLIALAADSGVTGSITPIEMQLTDNGDGTWQVTHDQALTLTLSVPGGFDLTETVAAQSFEGTFDEALMTFSAMEGAFSGIKLTQVIQSPDTPPTLVEVTLDSGSFTATGVAGAKGGADVAMTLKASGLTETMMAPMGEGQPPLPITLRAEELTEVITGKGVVFAGILQTAAWVVAHPDPASRDADKAGLKAILTAAMPFFGNVAVTGSATKLAVDSPVGTFSIDEIGFMADINGAVADGKFREGVTISGLTLPEGLVPDWAAPVVPQQIALDLAVTDFDPAAALTLALGLLDLPDPGAPGAEFDAQLQSAMLPTGAVTITLNPGSVSGDGYALTYTGQMVTGPDLPLPTGRARLTLTGADKLQAAINAAPEDMKAQAMMGFGMAQAMAKVEVEVEGDMLIWDIEAATPGALSVNGTPLMGGN